MSDDRQFGGTIEDTSIAQLREQAGHPRIRDDAITDLREHCLRVIEAANLNQHSRMMALPKLDEMIFWIRAGSGRA